MQQNIYKHNLNSGKHIYKHQLFKTQKSHTKVSLFKAYQYINYILKGLTLQVHVSKATRAIYKRLQNDRRPMVQLFQPSW
jgi:hypothetical protein